MTIQCEECGWTFEEWIKERAKPHDKGRATPYDKNLKECIDCGRCGSKNLEFLIPYCPLKNLKSIYNNSDNIYMNLGDDGEENIALVFECPSCKNNIILLDKKEILDSFPSLNCGHGLVIQPLLFPHPKSKEKLIEIFGKGKYKEFFFGTALSGKENYLKTIKKIYAFLKHKEKKNDNSM